MGGKVNATFHPGTGPENVDSKITPVLDADVVVSIVPSGSGYDVVVDNRADLPLDVLGALVRQAADEVEGKDDRARGCWGVSR